MNGSSGYWIRLFSDKDRHVYEVVNYVFMTGAVSLFGVGANVFNIVIFYKQGFQNTVNISFFGLAISDLCCLLTLLWFGLCVNPLFVNSDIPMVPSEVQHLTAGIPHICFARITGWITVFITAERCMCIMMPLKIKRIITPKRTTVSLCVIYAIIMISFLPEYGTAYIGWKFYPKRNASLLGLVFTSNRESVQGLVFFLYSILGSASFVAVIVLTAVLVLQLKQKSKWRMKANADKSQCESISARERKTVTMVVMIASVLIVCYIPGVAVSMVTFFEPEFSIVGKFVDAFFVLWSFVFVFEAINSSVNIFLYYNMSSKYRETFLQIMGFCNSEKRQVT